MNEQDIMIEVNHMSHIILMKTAMMYVPWMM